MKRFVSLAVFALLGSLSASTANAQVAKTLEERAQLAFGPCSVIDPTGNAIEQARDVQKSGLLGIQMKTIAAVGGLYILNEAMQVSFVSARDDTTNLSGEAAMNSLDNAMAVALTVQLVMDESPVAKRQKWLAQFKQCGDIGPNMSTAVVQDP